MRTKTTKVPEAPIKLYKVLTADGHSPYVRNYAWSLPTKNDDDTYTPGAWHEEPPEVLDLGHGLHITPAPRRHWPRENCIAYECEAEGYREDPATDHEAVALRVRLLHPITREEAQRITEEYDAGLYVRKEKERQKKRLDRAREAALAARRKKTVARAEGVESPALTAFRLLVELTPMASWRDTNSSYFAALAHATRWLTFEPEDIRTIYDEFRGEHWFGSGSGSDERLYAAAIAAKNASASVAWERFFDRKPWWYTSGKDRARLAVGSQLQWEGVWCTVTSFKGDGALVACTYRTALKREGDSVYERDKVMRRFTITREAYAKALGTKASKKTAVAK